jgi:predicted CopG family antitoxin
MPTTIQIEKDTLNKLKTFREYNRESYNEVINKLMKLKEMHGLILTEQTNRDIDEARKEKGIPLSEAIKELGVKIDL